MDVINFKKIFMLWSYTKDESLENFESFFNNQVHYDNGNLIVHRRPLFENINFYDESIWNISGEEVVFEDELISLSNSSIELVSGLDYDSNYQISFNLYNSKSKFNFYFGNGNMSNPMGITLQSDYDGNINLINNFVSDNVYFTDKSKLFNTPGWHNIILERKGNYGAIIIDELIFNDLPMRGNEDFLSFSSINNELKINGFDLRLI